MASSPYYDRPRLVPTPAGARAASLMTFFAAISALALICLWVLELVDLWSSNGFIGWLLLSIAVTLAYAVIAALLAGIVILRRFGILGAIALVVVGGWIFGWSFAGLLAIPAIAAMLAGFFGAGFEEIRPVEPKLLEQRIIGEPGAGLTAAIDKFGIENVTKGIAGEQLTSDAFAARSDVRVVQLINGLKFPGSADADVDHALVYGSKVAFLDSKYWAGTDFRWSGDTAITSGRGATLTVYETHFPKALTLLTEQLTAEGKTVRGWVVLHSNAGKTMTVEPGPAGLPTLVAGENWLDEVLAWLTDGQEIPADDAALGEHCDTMKAVLAFKQ